jgi:hypothetical protein
LFVELSIEAEVWGGQDMAQESQDLLQNVVLADR